jgi:hypothetical protein
VAWHAPSATLHVVEVKTSLVSVEETLRRHDVKARLAARIVGDRFGWWPRNVARLLVLPDESTARRRVADTIRFCREPTHRVVPRLERGFELRSDRRG